MKTKLWAMGLVLFCTLLTSSGQLFWKFGADKLEFNIISILTTYEILIGLLLYSIGGMLIIISYRGGEVSTLYPILATSFIWVSFLSIYFLNESMNIFKWMGILTIIGGIVLIGYGSNKSAGAGAF